jgi:hypothetical protein
MLLLKIVRIQFQALLRNLRETIFSQVECTLTSASVHIHRHPLGSSQIAARILHYSSRCMMNEVVDFNDFPPSPQSRLPRAAHLLVIQRDCFCTQYPSQLRSPHPLQSTEHLPDGWNNRRLLPCRTGEIVTRLLVEHPPIGVVSSLSGAIRLTMTLTGSGLYHDENERNKPLHVRHDWRLWFHVEHIQ